jgi:hypothetical protein
MAGSAIFSTFPSGRPLSANGPVWVRTRSLNKLNTGVLRRHEHQMLSAETLELALRPNRRGLRVNSRAFKRFWRPQKVSDRFTRARVDVPNFLFYILQFDVPSKHQAGSGTLGSSIGRSAAGADSSSKNLRLQTTAGDRVKKIVPLRHY